MVPVDYAATAILELLFAKRQHDVYHVSSGLERSPSTADLAAAFSSAFVSLPPFRFLAGASAAAWAKGIRGCSLDASRLAEVCDYLEYWIRTFGDERRMLALLSALRAYFRFMVLGQPFDNRRLLQDTGLQQSPPAHVYLPRCMQHVARVQCCAARRNFSPSAVAALTCCALAPSSSQRTFPRPGSPRGRAYTDWNRWIPRRAAERSAPARFGVQRERGSPAKG